ncbi:jg21, partial [Pararge aegeria aegeria]
EAALGGLRSNFINKSLTEERKSVDKSLLQCPIFKQTLSEGLRVEVSVNRDPYVVELSNSALIMIKVTGCYLLKNSILYL